MPDTWLRAWLAVLVAPRIRAPEIGDVLLLLNIIITIMITIMITSIITITITITIEYHY